MCACARPDARAPRRPCDARAQAAKYAKGYTKWIFIFLLLVLAAAGGVTLAIVLGKK